MTLTAVWYLCTFSLHGLLFLCNCPQSVRTNPRPPPAGNAPLRRPSPPRAAALVVPGALTVCDHSGIAFPTMTSSRLDHRWAPVKSGADGPQANPELVSQGLFLARPPTVRAEPT